MTDKSAHSQLFWYRALIITVIWGFTFTVSLPVILYVAPDVEARLYPVFVDQESQWPHLSEDKKFLLWVWKFTKNRRGRPEYISFMAYSKSNPQSRYPVEVFSEWDCKRNFRSDNASRSGEDVIRMMCAKLPVNLIGKDDVAIDGLAEYRVGHPFYTVPAKIISTDENTPAD